MALRGLEAVLRERRRQQKERGSERSCARRDPERSFALHGPTARSTRESAIRDASHASATATPRKASEPSGGRNYEAAAAELERTVHSIQRLLQNLESNRKAETARAKAEGRTPQPYSAGDFARAEGSLEWPLHGSLVGHFGPETHPKWGTVTPNNGVDIEAAVGTPVRAVARARVEYISEDYGTYGQMIILNHGDGYFTLYGHLSEIDVTVGQEVEAGKQIARSGDSGSLKGPILHFEVRKGGTPLDPEQWLK